MIEESRAHAGFPRANDFERLCRSIVCSRLECWRGDATDVADPEQSLREGNVALDSLQLLEVVADLNKRFALHETGIEDHLLVAPSLRSWGALIAKHFELKGEGAKVTFESSGSQGKPVAQEHAWSALESEVGAIISDVLTSAPPQRAYPASAKGRTGSTLKQGPNLRKRDRLASLRNEQENRPSKQKEERLRPDAVADPATRLLSLVAPHHIFGFLFTIMLPARMGWQVEDLSRSAPGKLARVVRSGDVVVATPFQLDLALGAAPLAQWPAHLRVFLSGASVPAELWRRAEDRGLSVTEVYGSTQTAGVGWRQSDRDPFVLFGDISRCDGRDGNLEVPTLVRQGLSLDLQDDLSWVSARMFTVGGRIDRCVQVGGVNVSPSSVARTLELHPMVGSAAVRLDPKSGRLKAFAVPAVPEADPEALETALRTFASDALRAPERPVCYTFGGRLPVASSGKPSDW